MKFEKENLVVYEGLKAETVLSYHECINLVGTIL